MQHRKVYLRGSTVRGTSGSFDSLRAKTLTVGSSLERVGAQTATINLLDVKEVSVGDSKANGTMQIRSGEDSGGRLVLLPRWTPKAGVITGDLLPSITSQPNAPEGAYTNLATTTSGKGTGAVLDVVVAVVGDPSTTPVVTAVTVQNAGDQYKVGDTLTVAASSLGGAPANLVFTLTDANVNNGGEIQVTFFNKPVLVNGAENTDRYKTDIQNSLLLQGNLYVGSGGSYNNYKTVVCKQITFRNILSELKTAANVLLNPNPFVANDTGSAISTPPTNTVARGVAYQNLNTTVSNGGTPPTLNITITDVNGVNTITGITVVSPGLGLFPGHVLTVTAGQLGVGSSEMKFTLRDCDFKNVEGNIALHSNGVLQVGNAPLTSDDRLKHNEVGISRAVSTLAKLEPMVYDKTETFLPADYKGPLDAEVTPYRKESGFIAQDVQKIPELKHLVTPGSSNVPYSLNYHGLLAFIVQASQENSSTISAQAKALSSLTKKQASMASEIRALKAQVQELKSSA